MQNNRDPQEKHGITFGLKQTAPGLGFRPDMLLFSNKTVLGEIMFGTVIGDIVGSRFEFSNKKPEKGCGGVWRSGQLRFRRRIG